MKELNNPHAVTDQPYTQCIDSLNEAHLREFSELHPLVDSANMVYEALFMARTMFFQVKARDFTGADIAYVANMILNNRDKA